MKQWFTLLLCLVLTGTALAQDQHFSQFFASPLTLNPALTGMMQGKTRISFIYRDQWGRNVLDYPFKTFSGAADFRFAVSPRQRRNRDAFGVGLLVYSDRVPVVDFSTSQIMLSGAYHKSLNPRSNQFLSLGAQFGLAQRNISYHELSFEDEFNGEDGYAGGATGEIFPENNFAYSDLQVGLNYTYAPERGVGVFAGAAMHHVMRPELSFYHDTDDDPEQQISNRLFRKYSAYLNLELPLGKAIKLHPRALLYLQGPHMAGNAGTNVRILLNDFNSTAIHIGGWMRGVRNRDEYGIDSFIALFGVEFSNFLFGLSYDIEFDAAYGLSRNQGAFEISVTYLGDYDEDGAVLCPVF